MDSRFRGNDINCLFAVIPAKAGIHTAYPNTDASPGGRGEKAGKLLFPGQGEWRICHPPKVRQMLLIAGRKRIPAREIVPVQWSAAGREDPAGLGRDHLATPSMHVLLARPRGFCAGVVRAVDIVDRALEVYGPPVYVRHEIVHNKHVVDSLRAKGARFVEDIADIPEGAITVFSAHGVSRKVVDDAGDRGLRVIDATCPLVSKVHNETRRYARQGHEVVLIGHRGHPEVEGTMGQVSGTVHLVADVGDVEKLRPAGSAKLAYVTQTTLSVDDTREIIAALKARFPGIRGPDVKDICYATQNRQSAVRLLADRCDVILVIGADYSSNSNRLQEIGAEAGTDSYLIPDAAGLDPAWLEGARTVGITAGASAPEELVQALVDRLGEMFDITVTDVDGIEENVTFRLPLELLEAERQSVDAAANDRRGSL